MNEDCFYCYLQRNNVVVLFGNLKVQSFGLTEVSDCCLLIVVTSSTFLKRNIWMIFAKKVGGVGPWKKEEVKMGWGDELLCLNKCYDMNETSSQTGTMLFSQYHNRLFIPQLSNRQSLIASSSSENLLTMMESLMYDNWTMGAEVKTFQLKRLVGKWIETRK